MLFFFDVRLRGATERKKRLAMEKKAEMNCVVNHHNSRLHHCKGYTNCGALKNGSR